MRKTPHKTKAGASNGFFCICFNFNSYNLNTIKR